MKLNDILNSNQDLTVRSLEGGQKVEIILRNPTLNEVFKEMESIGWSLDDFFEVYEAHKDTLGQILREFEEGEREEDEMVWMSQFVGDFLDCLESNKVLDKLTNKLKRR